MEAENLPEEKKVYTSQEILSLRRAGAPKPSDITWTEWKAPTQLNSTHELVAYMTATGQSRATIADVAGISPEAVSRLLGCERTKFRIKELQFQIFGKDPHKRFESILSTAIQTVSDILEDPKIKPAVKLQAAQTVLDRVMGKPKQSIEVKDVTLADFYGKLDQMFAKKEGDVVDAEIVENEIKKRDHIDQWVDDNL